MVSPKTSVNFCEVGNWFGWWAANLLPSLDGASVPNAHPVLCLDILTLTHWMLFQMAINSIQ